MGNSNANKRPAPDTAMQYRKNKYAAPVGGIFLFLAVVGFIAVAFFCVRFTQGLLDNTTEKQRFEQVILPVVMLDPATFDKATDLDPLFLLQSSFWSTILGEKRSSYTYDDLGRLIVPASDVDVACARLFGPDVKLQHQTFGTYEDINVYVEEEKTYYAAVSGQVGLYTPSVESVEKNGNLFKLVVGYIPPTNVFTQMDVEENGRAKPAKEMTYVLEKVRDHYQLIQITDPPPKPSSSSQQAVSSQETGDENLEEEDEE